MIYMQTLIKWLRLLFYKKSAFDGYTFDLDEYTPITEEDYESVTALSSPAVTSPRRRSKGSTFQMTETDIFQVPSRDYDPTD